METFHDQDASQEDWLAGAVLEAEAENLEVPGLCISFQGLDLPEPDPDPNVA